MMRGPYLTRVLLSNKTPASDGTRKYIFLSGQKFQNVRFLTIISNLHDADDKEKKLQLLIMVQLRQRINQCLAKY